MLLDFNELFQKYHMKIDGVLHVGAHLAEEAPLYRAVKVSNVTWVEGNPSVMPKLRRILKPYKHKLVNALVYKEDDIELTFNVTNYEGMSSSILEFGTHTGFSPDIEFVKHLTLKSKTIDTIVKENKVKANFLNMDLQGAELFALMGAEEFLKNVDYIMTEVNKDEVYVGCAQIGQLDEFLTGFKRVETFWVGQQGWGDALYIREHLV